MEFSWKMWLFYGLPALVIGVAVTKIMSGSHPTHEGMSVQLETLNQSVSKCADRFNTVVEMQTKLEDCENGIAALEKENSEHEECVRMPKSECDRQLDTCADVWHRDSVALYECEKKLERAGNIPFKFEHRCKGGRVEVKITKPNGDTDGWVKTALFVRLCDGGV